MTTISPIRTEVLQGLDRGRDFDLARKRPASLVALDGGSEVAVAFDPVVHPLGPCRALAEA